MKKTIIYFSGTGNTKYLAEKFSEKMNYDCCSIEENKNFDEIINMSEIIAFAYPIYGGTVPYILRKFLKDRKKLLINKKVIIFCTQLGFSGDGARVFTDEMQNIDCEVIYAEHFNMPNNIPNFPIFKVKNGDENNKIVKKMEKKLDKTCKNILNGKVVKRGFNKISKKLGESQSVGFKKIEDKMLASFKTNENCNVCSLCTQICSMNNLEIIDNKVVHKNQCTACMRCVNKCPKKAISVLGFKQPGVQYKGIL